MAIGSAAMVQGHPSPRPIVLEPNSYAQERWCLSTAPVKVWSSRVRKGKSWGVCMDAVHRCLAIPGYPAAVTRLEFASMRESTMQTLQRMLGPDLWGMYWSESKATLFFPAVQCDDGVTRQSRIVLFGWLDPGRKLSTEYGLIVVDQAEQIDREHAIFAQTRLNFFDPWQEQRAAALGITPRQLGLVCNPDDPDHWINQDYEIEARGMGQRATREGTGYEVILSQATDNDENLTADYRARQESYKGSVWYRRLVEGRWERAEGLVYSSVFSPATHIIERPAEWARWRGFPPPDWPRHRAIDFGVQHPFTCAWYAERPDRVLVCYREIYGTGRAPSEWAEEILRLEAKELAAWRAEVDESDLARWAPYVSDFSLATSVSDHEMGWRKELQRSGVWTRPAEKDIKGMIATMTSALSERRLLYVSDLLEYRDEKLDRDRLPCSVLEEYGRYKWRKRPAHNSEGGEGRFDVPIDRDNHGLDRDGYMLTAYLGARRSAVA